MTHQFCITADVDANTAEIPVGFEVWLNNSLVQNIEQLTSAETVKITVNDTDAADHELKFVLKNKTQLHTTVDSDGNIVKDTVVSISNLKFDDVELGQMFYDLAVYRHNFNGTGSDTEEKFYGTMGCNGTVSLKFTSPIYLWLLENM